ncbi:MAG: PHP domain-containing protein [Peptococcaceae bacterium]
MKGFFCDFHIHSTLSPCASLEMSPQNIIKKAKEAGLDIIAITDHNMVENTIYVHELGRKLGLTVLFGMELQTWEEIHLLVLFDNYKTALDFQREIYEFLPAVKNDPVYFGDQVVVDENDNIVRVEEKLLLNSVRISLDEAVSRVKLKEGLVIPSHIDSQTYSIISQLGYVPENLSFDALEVCDKQKIREFLPFINQKDLPLVTFSDAHYLIDIGKRRTVFYLEEPSFEEVVKALKFNEGRYLEFN